MGTDRILYYDSYYVDMSVKFIDAFSLKIIIPTGTVMIIYCKWCVCVGGVKYITIRAYCFVVEG